MASKINEVTNIQWQSVNQENRKMTDEFLKQSTHLSPQSLKQYTSALHIYYWWVKENAEDKPFYQLKSRDYLKFQNYLSENGMSSSGIKLKRSAVSSFNNYVELYYLDLYKDFRNYITKGIANPPPAFVHKKEPLTMEEYNRLCSVLEEKKLYQQLAYLKFSFSSGARRAEVRQLVKDDLKGEPKIIGESGNEKRIYN